MVGSCHLTAALTARRFKSGSVPVLLATDVASRGLDIPSVDMVVNFDVPMLAKDYVHRVGRTGRATRPGWALTLVSQVCSTVQHLLAKFADIRLNSIF